jgi:hypothetical protein
VSADIEDEGIDDFILDKAVDTPEAPVEDDSAYEEQARKIGWKPQDQFNLDPKLWKPARAYVESPQGQLKIVRDELAEQRRHNAATDAIAKQAHEAIRRQERQRFEQELNNVRAAKEEAVEAADKDRYQQLDQYEYQLRTTPAPPQVHPDVIAYKETPEGKQWMDDPILVNWARDAINAGALDKSPAEQMRWANEKVREYFPHKFQPRVDQPREDNGRYTASRVDGGGLAGGNRSSGLDADERAAYAEIKKRQPGLFKNEAEYIAHARSLGVRE